MNILFVCVENSNRSQMAQAFTKMLGSASIKAYSAGSNPSGHINLNAISAMSELGYDLSTHKSTHIEDLPDVEFDYVISMRCGEKCPWVSAKERLDWDIPDPKNLTPSEFIKVRDEIKEKVEDLLSTINTNIMSDDDTEENKGEKSKLRSETAERYYIYLLQNLSMRIQFSDKISDERKEELNEELINNEPTLEWMANVADELGFIPQFDFKEKPAPSAEDLKTKSGMKKFLLEQEGFYEADDSWPGFNWQELSIRVADGVKLESNVEDYEEDPEDESKMVKVLYPERLDFENMSPTEITDEHVKFVAGGDWQLGSLITVKLGEDDQLYITDCYALKDDETDPGFNHLDTDAELAAFGLPARQKA